MRRTLLAAAAAALAAAPARAQDIEALAAVTGRTLPPGYYARVRRDPHFFDGAREWRGRVAADAELLPRPAVRGDLRMVVMMGLFADSPEPPVSAGTVHQQLFGDNPLGNLTDFYRETSAGMMSIQGAVLPWVRTGIPRARAVGESYGLGDDADLAWYLWETVSRLDAATNFAQYDNDGPDNVPNSGDDDGYVDLAVFQFAEAAASCGDLLSVWPHRSGLSGWLGWPYVTDDMGAGGEPVKVNDYHIQSAVNCDGTPQSIATIAHETGHAFGLGDYYDASDGLLPFERRWVLGCWSLMAAGAWGCGDGGTFGKTVSPPHMGPYEKAYLGWITPTYTQPGWRREYVLPPVQQSAKVLRVPLVGSWEYLLLEYRPNTGYDRALPAGGVLVYHVDTERPPRACVSCPRYYTTTLVEADGDSALLRRADEGGDRGVAGDVFNGRRTLDDFTHPALRLTSGERTGVALDIDVADGVARILVSTVPTVATARLISPILGAASAAPSEEERAALDRFGNRNGGYDLGDLRSYMRYRPGTVRQDGP